MKKFEHINASSYEEASKLIRESNGTFEAMAGGTDLLGTYKDEILPEYPKAVVNLKTIPNTEVIAEEPDTLVIGAGAKLARLAENNIVKEGCEALAQAAYSVASPLVRSLATIGGNICQDVRCWYYRYPNSVGGRLECKRKGGDTCYAICGENRYHSIFGGMQVNAAPCQHNCPAGTDIPGYMAEIRKGNWAGAADIFFKYNPMPMMTSRICPHVCKDGCNQNVYGESVNIPAVERSLGDYIMANKETYYAAPANSTGKKCAVIGAGPGGLSAAYYLRREGHEVTVYDAHEKAGGVLRYGIPHYRLPKAMVDEFCDALKDIMGIRFVMNTVVGKDIAVEEIKAEHDVVYFGTGAWSQPVLGLDGENLTQFGLNFLVEVNTYLQAAIGEDVLVCGGGNVAMDVALTAKRLGARTVKLVCLEQREEMPASPEEVAMALEEGVEIYNGWGLAKVLGDENGKVCGLESMRCTSVRDENGRFAPTYDESDRTVYHSDFIILATGQKVDISFLGERLGAQLKTARGLIDTDMESGRTKEEGFYAGGDVVTGPDLAIRAIKAGRVAAATMNRDLGGVSAEKAEKKGFLTFDVAGVECTAANKLPETPAAERTLTGEDFHSYEDEAAAAEAKRCLNCGCYAVNPSDITPVLVLADAQIITTERTFSAEELFTSRLTVQDVLHKGELVKEIRVPKLSGVTKYDKRRVRNAIDFAIVSLASNFVVKDGVIEQAGLVFGAVAPVPYRMKEVEEYLKGKEITENVIAEAKELAKKHVFTMSKNEYKVLMMLDMLEDAILRASK